MKKIISAYLLGVNLNRYYENPEHKKELGDIEIGKYVACSIVVFNLDTKQVKWNTHLDLSTDSVRYRAFTYSSPTVVDFDGDGFLEIVVGTSMGYVYVLRHNGKAISTTDYFWARLLYVRTPGIDHILTCRD